MLSWAAVKGSGVSGVTWMQTSALFKAWVLWYLSSMNLLFSHYCSCLKHCGGMIWVHEPLDLIPALVRAKSIRGSFYVPPRASYNGCKVNNSISHFQPGHPLRDTSFLTGPIKEIQTLGTDGSLVEMSCSLVRRWVLLSIQWGLGKWGGAVAGGCCEFLWGLGLHHWYRVLVIVSNSSSWVFTEGQTEERE